MKAPANPLPRTFGGGLPVFGSALAVLLTLVSPSHAEESKPSDPNASSASAAAKPAAPTRKVFTNRDLARYRSARSTGRIVVDMNAAQQAKDDAAAAPPENTLYPDEKARRVTELQDSIKETEGKLAALDRRLAFMANPFLPPPQLTPEEIKAQQGLSQKQAYLALQAEKEAAAQKLAELKADLDKVIATPIRQRSLPGTNHPAASQQPQP